MSTASKTAIGGMATALIVVLLIPTAFSVFVYALPVVAGAVVMVCVVELGKGWAASVYAASSVVSFLIVSNREAVILYALFFGYYGILKAVLEGSRLKRPVVVILKFLLFNAAMALSYFALTFILNMSFLQIMGVDSGVWWAKYALLIFIVLGNAVFVLYDFAMTRAITVYLVLLRPKMKKLFRFK